nr:DUF2909 domain-containing protein [Rubrivivax gelatinosus]
MIFIMLLGVVAALGAAGVALLRPGAEGERERRMARALAWRVGLSIALFVALLLAWQLGWIRPTGLPAG